MPLQADSTTVTPAKAGVHRPTPWIPAFAGMTTLIAGSVALAAAFLPLSARADLPTFRLVAENARFTPETLEVPANTRFRLEVTNRNAGPEEFETSSPFKELVLAPGVTRSTLFPPLKPGTYPFFGEFHPDTAKGRIIAK